MEERPARPEPGGVKPPIDPPSRIALGGPDGQDDDDAWYVLQEALRERTGALLGPFELLAEQHSRHGSVHGQAEVHEDWPFDSWLIRALPHLPEMSPEEVQMLWQLFLFPCSTLHKQIELERVWVDRHSAIRRFVRSEDRRIAQMEQALKDWDEMIKLVEERLRDFPERWQVPSRYSWRRL